MIYESNQETKTVGQVGRLPLNRFVLAKALYRAPKVDPENPVVCHRFETVYNKSFKYLEKANRMAVKKDEEIFVQGTTFRHRSIE